MSIVLWIIVVMEKMMLLLMIVLVEMVVEWILLHCEHSVFVLLKMKTFCYCADIMASYTIHATLEASPT